MAVSAAIIAAKFTPEDLHMYRVTFEQFDEDGSGKIDVGELQRALRGCGIECSGEEVIAMMSTVDTSGDLEIDFDEFLQLIYTFRTEQEYASTSDSSDDDGGGDADPHAAAYAYGARRPRRAINSAGASKGRGVGGGAGAGGGIGFAFVGDEAALYGLTAVESALFGSGRGGGRSRMNNGSSGSPSRRPSVGRSHSISLMGGGAGDDDDEDADDEAGGGGSGGGGLANLSRLRVAAVTQCPEHSLRGLVSAVRQVREGLVLDISAMAGDGAEEERRIVVSVLQRLAHAKCPFVPSGSFIGAARARREQQFAALLGSSTMTTASATAAAAAPARGGGPSTPSSAAAKKPPAAAAADGTSISATSAATNNNPPQVPAPTLTQIISFIDEVLDAANERMLSLVNYTLAYNSDDLYMNGGGGGGLYNDEQSDKQQRELLELVEAAAAVVSGSGARAAKRLSSTSASPMRAPPTAAELSSSASSLSGEGTPKKARKGGKAAIAKNNTTASRRVSTSAIAGSSTAGGKLQTETPSFSAKKGVGGRPTPRSGQHAAAATSRGDRQSEKVSAALDDLSNFSFEVARGDDQQVGSDAFRAAAKKFPYFMFPIGSVCAVIDALEKVHDTYEKALEGREFLVRPRCKDGARCRLLGVLQHQLALSHPCYSDVIPCPHRHRPMHMACYHHDEDENPSAQATLLELQRQLGVLDLSGLEMGDTGAKCLAHVLSRDLALRGREKHRIKHLKLSGNQISPEGAAALFEHCSHLLSLDMSNNGLGYKGNVLTGSAVGPALQRLLAAPDAALLSLNLSRNRLSDRDAKYLTEALKDNTTLTDLDVQKNEFGALFGAHMASALQENRELKCLSVGWNRLEGSGTATLLAEVCKSSTIEFLDLSWTGVSNEGAALLADFVAGSQLLRHLALAHNSITGEGLTTAKGPESQKTLAKAIQTSKTLTYLDVSFNSLGTKAARDFLRDLQENLVLEHLDVRCVKAADDVASEAVRNYVRVRAAPPSLKPVTVLFGSSVTGAANGPTNPIRAETMGGDPKPKAQQPAGRR